MNKTKVLLLCGGEGTEHEISLISSQFIEKSLKKIDSIEVTRVETKREIDFNKLPKSDFVIPCYHGYPGETGDIQSYLQIKGIPYLGVGPEASTICFNKVTSKLWFDALDIPNTPYKFIHSIDQFGIAQKTLENWKTLFVKASNQGSSVGCYRVSTHKELKESLDLALKLSPYVLLEKEIKGRELEVSAYEYKGALYISRPGEILCPEGSYYSYEEKYDQKSSTSTALVAKGLTQKSIDTIEKYARQAFQGLKLRHLSRIDFFLQEDEAVILNEINTFPGMTEISMFPKMMEENGHKFSDFLEDIIYRSR